MQSAFVPLLLQKIFSGVKRLLLLLLFLCNALSYAVAQPLTDSTSNSKDTLQQVTALQITNQYQQAWQTLLVQNKFLNSSGTPTALVVKQKKYTDNNGIFYLISSLLLLLALLRFFFSRYFSTLFRVFFNTSLRQSQLTDQLVQAKLPSMLFNLFFALSGGIYIYFVFHQYKYAIHIYPLKVMAACMLVLVAVYTIKYSTLKFTGWATGFKAITDTYVFVIFLICKIIGVLLVPFIVMMAFADRQLAAAATLTSLLIIGILFLLRFFRSYGLLQNQLKVSGFHFLLYIVGIEILPLLLIYKGLLIFLSKNP
jgi:hypothetical protein